MDARTTVGGPHEGLVAWLASHDIEYEIHHHKPAFTARTTAMAEGVDPRTFAKVIVVALGGRHVLVVLDATDQLDLHKASRAFEVANVRLITEPELAALAPGFEVGAMPAVGALFGLPTYADYAVRDDPEISFNGGNHRTSVRVERAAWERACSVTYADLAADAEGGPVWAR